MLGYDSLLYGYLDISFVSKTLFKTTPTQPQNNPKSR